MAEKRILFVAQAQSVTPFFSKLKEAGVEAGIADSLSGALAYLKKTTPSLIFTQSKIVTYRAESLLAAAEEMGDFPPVIVFAARGTADEAQYYLDLGARDYWLEPLLWEKIAAVLPDDAPQAAAPPEPAKTAQAAATPPKFTIIGSHPAIGRVLALAKQVAPSKATVLISGESGTGKEMFARYLHAHSDRAGCPFVAINCAALPEHLLESELFGHEKGAFTGAIGRKLGKFELADSGTILLDEISEMELGLQAKLLRVLQEGEFDRVGGVEPVKVDVRVLATTNRKIEQAVEEHKFRQDLYYRLNVIPLKLPPLRDRGEDVALLTRFFIDRYTRAYALPRLELSPEAATWLREYDWPGNVRELQNLMERAVLLAGRGPIRKVHFLLDGDAWAGPEPDATGPDATLSACAPSEPDAFQAGDAVPAMPGGVVPLSELEKIMILRSLDQTSGNRTQAAELLGISVRTLRNKLNEYRLQGMAIS
ncbi:MAG: sigma-54-dependent Fis family transcriptional regulator [Desulfovibrionaceae bacterium]|nr:sigma-54-dependent Fis family transcriptional regulator [Desulfovibrionaceae bacterium]